MPGVRDNDPVSVSSRLLFSFGSICFSGPFCKFIYLNFGYVGVLVPVLLVRGSYIVFLVPYLPSYQFIPHTNIFPVFLRSSFLDPSTSY
jgi:hypothetical protein